MRFSKEKYLSDFELTQLEKSLDLKHRDALMIRLLLETGARQEELVRMRTSNIDLRAKTIFIPGAKKSDSRTLPLKSKTLELLREYCSDKDALEPLFDVSTRRLRQIWYDFKPHNCAKSLHCLRHTFAMTLFKAKRDLRLVQFALGHRDIKNTMVYASYVYKTDELARIFEEVG